MCETGEVKNFFKVVASFGLVVLAVCTTSQTVLAVGSSTYPATDVTQQGATLNGAVTHGNSDYVFAFVISTSPDFSAPVYQFSNSCPDPSFTMIIRGSVGGFVSAGTSPISFSLNDWGPCTDGTLAMDGSNVKHLDPSRTYYFRAGIQTGNDSCMYQLNCYDLGSIQSFTTRAAVMPVITDTTSKNVGPDSATFASYVTANDAKTSVSFEYSTELNFSNSKFSAAVAVLKGSSPTQISIPVKGLLEDTTYFFRSVAKNVYGMVLSTTQSFQTRPPVGISINEAAEYTNDPQVELSMSWPPDAVSMLISNDGGFRTQKSYPLADKIDWTLVSSGDERLPKNVYLKFVLTDGSRTSVMSDDIILDTTAPVITTATGTSVMSSRGVSVQSVSASKAKSAKLIVRSRDNNSGVAALQVKSSPSGKASNIAVNKVGTVVISSTLRTSKKILFVRVVDRAGNSSTGWKIVRVR
jgi:hypothetical protein